MKNNQKGVIHLIVPLLLLLIIGVVAYIVISQGIIKNPFKNIPFIGKIGVKEPTVAVKSEYKNPFKKETQYVNPFETYKNPFAVAK